MMMTWIIYIAPYCENYTSRALVDYWYEMVNKCVFNCFLNNVNEVISLISKGKLFHAVGPAKLNARSPNRVFVVRRGIVTVHSAVGVDRKHVVDSSRTTGLHSSVKYPGAMP